MKQEQNKRGRQLALLEKWKIDAEIMQEINQRKCEQMKQDEKDLNSHFKNKCKKDH